MGGPGATLAEPALIASDPSSAPIGTEAAAILAEAARRRTFAIISHPDAGKTTLTEKLLLYGGALTEAGAIKTHGGGRREVTSDWMALERARGISVTSTVLRFAHGNTVLNLLDTPGHRDFSEDTLRVLAAADCAVMLLDAARGVQEQTLKLFQVARARGIPLITLVNKCDRPGMEPLAMIDHIEATLSLATTPVTWPVGHPGAFQGVLEADSGTFVRFTRSAHGATRAGEERLTDSAPDPTDPAWVTAAEELELLAADGRHWDRDAFLAGELTPVLFGSALWNFGVSHLLEAIVARAPAPTPRRTVSGEALALEGPLSALVFKVQANMDPRHRDRIAFVRICSGEFRRGMRVVNSRTGRPVNLAHAHELFGQERTTIDAAFPGDIIGVVNAADVLVGDTLSAGDPVAFPPIPTLAPEHFVTVHNRDPTRRKQFHRALTQLDQEGVVQLYHRAERDPAPVLAAVGPLQFDVAVHRLADEFSVQVRLDPLDLHLARRVAAEDAEAVRASRWAELLERGDGTRLAAFRTPFALAQFREAAPAVTLDELTAR
ncbi:peptide chain release factor 3 [Conexibacter sp. DBS9H8]|uniref:peptide chain release factor 3 n=1 Tax=Conexibacter sp. DBS9H8 TaxID=2937801 RepID=UPI00200C1229|nr:peptide chain release factor 3 [Conexibacter sp. DBS9H8]